MDPDPRQTSSSSFGQSTKLGYLYSSRRSQIPHKVQYPLADRTAGVRDLVRNRTLVRSFAQRLWTLRRRTLGLPAPVAQSRDRGGLLRPQRLLAGGKTCCKKGTGVLSGRQHGGAIALEQEPVGADGGLCQCWPATAPPGPQKEASQGGEQGAADSGGETEHRRQ
eukprot:scaffold1282_cov251-Pinguiococcus_pyrenoidosus.AAC.50